MKAALHELARQFEERITPAAAPDGCAGWGQFLDGPQQYPQVGLYGTCAGVLVRALAGRGHDLVHGKAIRLLRHWWDNPDHGTAAKLTQVPRLAFLHLSLRVAGEAAFGDLVAASLKARMLAAGLYADTGGDGAAVATPRVLPTAMAIASFSILRGESSPPDEWAKERAEKLATFLPGQELSPLELAVASLAVLAGKPKETGNVRRRLRAVAHGGSFKLEDFGVYFLEYWDHEPGGAVPRRDYFIAPTTVVFALCGLMQGAPGSLRVRSDEVVNAVLMNVQRNRVLVAGRGSRVSTKNQAWAAVLLAARAERPAYVLDRVAYSLRKRRPENWLTGIALPLLAYTVAAFGAVYTDGALKAVPTLVRLCQIRS